MIRKFCDDSQPTFYNRKSAGQQLAQKLLKYSGCPDVLVLALPRGGVPVAAEVATVLHCSLDLCCVRKLGVPRRSELAFGAIASGGIRVLNRAIIDEYQIDPIQQQQIEQQEQQELKRREQLYRGNRPYPKLEHQTVVLVDDGLATGSTMMAAITFVEQQQAHGTIVAIPVAPPSIYQYLQQQVDQVICLITPDVLSAVGYWYDDFRQVSDTEVQKLLLQQKWTSTTS